MDLPLGTPVAAGARAQTAGGADFHFRGAASPQRSGSKAAKSSPRDRTKALSFGQLAGKASKTFPTRWRPPSGTVSKGKPHFCNTTLAVTLKYSRLGCISFPISTEQLRSAQLRNANSPTPTRPITSSMTSSNVPKTSCPSCKMLTWSRAGRAYALVPKAAPPCSEHGPTAETTSSQTAASRSVLAWHL